MTRASATKLRWTLAGCLFAAAATAGALVAMANSSNFGAGAQTSVRTSVGTLADGASVR